MSGSRLGLCSLLLLLLAFAAPAFAAEEGLQAVDSAWVTAMKANDVEAVMRTYATDAVAWLPDEREARGSVAIRASYVGLLAAYTVNDAAVSTDEYRTVGDSSVGWGTYTLTLTPKAGGAPVVMTGRFSAVAERRDGRWVYVVDHASAEPPPAASEAETPESNTAADGT